MAADPIEPSESWSSSSRREFLRASALAAASAAPIAGVATAADSPAPGAPAAGKEAGAGGGRKDPYALAERFNHFLRVTDVTDELDAVGRADLTLLDAGIRRILRHEWASLHAARADSTLLRWHAGDG